jgi:hypothetical protein
VLLKKNVLSAVVGLAMLALPASALAGHHQDWDDYPRPYASHHQAPHQGWFKHHRQYVPRPVEDEDDEAEHYHFRPRYRQPSFLCDADGDDCKPTNHRYDDDDYRPPISYYRSEPGVRYGLIQKRNWLIDRK